MNVCMKGWMDGWREGGREGGRDGWLNAWMHGWMDVMNITQCGGGGENSCLLHRRVASALIILGAFLLCGV